MYLRSLKLWNFRKYGVGNSNIDLGKPDLSIPFKKGLNVLIGENDSGKTAIIDAIKIVVKTHSAEWIGVDEDDFNINTTRLRIECEFGDIDDNEAKNFTEYLNWEGDEGKKLPVLKIFVDVSKKDGRVMPFDIKAGNDEDGVPINAEAREKLKSTYLKPLRDAKSELIPRRNSRLSQILRTHPTFKTVGGAKHYLAEEFEKFNKGIKNYFEGKDAQGQNILDQEGKNLKSEIDRYLNSFSGKESEFLVSDGDIRQILERLELAFNKDTNLGLGSHNILFISTELVHLNKQNWDGLRLGLIEEIEAHLHPQIQLKMIEKLQENENIQLILTTHSPNIGSKVKLENLIICHGDNAYSLGKDYTLLKPEDYKFLERFLDVTKANLFFAKGVILVEGWGEELLLPSLAQKVGVNFSDKGISVINIANTAFLRYSRIFQRKDGKDLKLPVAVVTDLDVKPSEENEVVGNGKTKALKKKEDKEAKYSGGSVSAFISPHWTLEYCIALSPLFREHLFNAIKNASVEQGDTITDNWTTITNGKTPEQIAQKLYDDYIGDGKKISKSIIAQHLAQILDSLPAGQLSAQDLEQDPSVNYLVKAIKYASGN